MAERVWEGVAVLQKVAWESLIETRTFERRRPHGVLREEHSRQGRGSSSSMLGKCGWRRGACGFDQGWVAGDCTGRPARVGL